jgi:uncharacterized protein
MPAPYPDGSSLHDLEAETETAGAGAARLLAELLWRRLDVPGIEYFRLWETAHGPRLAGTVIFAHDGAPVRLKYGVACAPDWTTRGVHVVLTRGETTRHLKLVADGARRWWRSDQEVPRARAVEAGAAVEPPAAVERAAAGADAGAPGGSRRPPRAVEILGVAGCLDVDLAFTPATNLLPMRRLGLAAGESGDLTAAWVRFPDLDVQPLPQRYTRLAERRWRYQSRGGAFTAELEVDDLGLVVRYPPLWERAATAAPAAGS